MSVDLFTKPIIVTPKERRSTSHDSGHGLVVRYFAEIGSVLMVVVNSQPMWTTSSRCMKS
jgi:hypothetical protein